MKITKALTFRASSIGDCLMGKYLLENIHAEFPHARLGIVVSSRSAMIRDLFEAYPWIEVVEANRRNPLSLWRLWRDWRRSDLIVTQYAGKPGGKFSLASKIVAWLLSRRGGLLGFTDTSRINHTLYGTLVPFDINVAPAEHERKALRAVGIPIAVERPRMHFVSIPDTKEKFGIETPFIIIHLFAGNKGRGLSLKNKRTLLKEMSEQFPEYQLVVSGGPADKKEAKDATRGISANIIAGDTSLQEFMNLIAESSAVVSVDTGAAHLSAQLGTPLVVLRTCLGPNWWNTGQYGKNTSIRQFNRADLCTTGHTIKTFPDCINDIDMAAAVKEAREIRG